jgi:hypothetical protein
LSNELTEPRASFADPDRRQPRRKALQEHALWEELLVYAPDAAQAFSLNPCAKAIWELCDGRHTVADICRELGSRFACAEAQLQTDVRQAVHRLEELGLLEAEGASRPAAAESDGRS